MSRDALNNYFKQIESERRELIELFNKLNDEQRHFKPTADEWSVCQVIEHLVTAETGSVAYMRKKLSDPSRMGNTSLRNRFNSFLLNISLKSPIKFKAPNVPGLSPDDRPDADTVIQRWDAARKELESIIGESETDLLDKKVFRHPFAGPMDMMSALQFMGNHVQHHRPQIKGIMNKTGFPA